MTTVVLSAVGGAIGGSIGGPVGAAIGQLAGAFIGSLIDPAKIEGPRIGDTKLQRSTYGAMIPYVWGKGRIGTNIIDQTDLQEHGEDSGKGGGGVTSYTYSASWCAALCMRLPNHDAAIAGIESIFMDGLKVWDSDSGEECPCRVYCGTEDQQPDPTFEAIHGVGTVPGYRGLAYLVFTDYNLKDWGNRIPNVEAVVYTDGGPIPWRVSEFDAWDEPILGNWVLATAAYSGGVLTTAEMGNGGDTTFIIRKWNLDGTQIGDDITLYAGDDSDAAFAIYNANVFARWYGFPNEVHWYYYDDADQEIKHGIELSHGVTPTNCYGGVYMDDHIYIVVNKDGDHWLMKYECPGGTNPGAFVAEVAIGDGLTGLQTITMAASDTGHIYVTRPPAVGSGTCMVRVDADTMEIDHVWDEAETTDLVGSTGRAFYVKGDLICKAFAVGGVDPYVIRLVKINDDYSLEQYGEEIPAGGAHSVYLGNNLLLDNMGVYSLSSPGAAVSLEQIVTDITALTPGATVTQDFSELTDEVPFYLIGQLMTARNAVEALRKPYPFDLVEEDYGIVGRRRGERAVITIPDADLCARPAGEEPGDPLMTSRKREQELPRTVTMKYIAIDMDYQTGAQASPRQVTQSEYDVTLDVPVGLTAEQAAQKCWTIQTAEWEERESFHFATSLRWAKITPATVVEVRGRVIRVRTVTETPDGVITYEGVLAAPSIYTQTTTGTPAVGVVAQEPLRPLVATRLVLLDIPVLTQGDAPFGFYAAMAPAAEGRWPGANLYKSIDGGVTWIAVASTQRAATIGITADSPTGSPSATGTLSDYAGGDVVEEASICVVLGREQDVLSSTTSEGLDNGANLCAISRGGSGGPWELLQFRDAELIEERTYLLSGFKRGRYGTTPSGHGDGDQFVLLPVTNVDAPQSELNVPLLYKAVTFGRSLSQSAEVEFTNTGEGSDEWHEVVDANLPSNLAGYVLTGPSAAVPNARVITAGDNITIEDNGPGGTLVISATGGGGGTGSDSAPADAQYLTLAIDSYLDNERVATGSANIAIADAGAGSTATFDLTETGVAAGIYGSSVATPQISVDKYGRVTEIESIDIVGTIVTLDEGSLVDSDAIALNFVGAGVTATDAGSGVTTITIPGGGAASLPLNTYTSSHTLDAGDDGCIVEFDASSPCVCTVPTGLPAEFACQITQSGTGAVSVAASGSTIQSYNNALTLAGRYASATLSTVGSDTFNLAGNITPIATGTGIPSGGSTGQALVKNSGTDYDVTWSSVTAAPGGSNTQVQFNNAGAFGGSSSFTWSGTRLSPNYVTLAAGTTSAGTSPLKFTSGSLMTTAEAGAVEFLADKWYATITSGAARKEFALWDAAATSGRIPYVTTNGRLVDSSALLWDSSNSRLGVGASPGTTIHATQSVSAGQAGYRAENTNAAGYAGFENYTTSGRRGYFNTAGASSSFGGVFAAGSTFVGCATAGDFYVIAEGGGVKVVSGGSATTNVRIDVDSNGNVAIGNAAIATNATNCFLYIPSCAGTPTGVPTTKTGRNAMVWDSTNKKLYVYDGSWLAMN